jgi:polyphosphate kinase
MSTVCGISDRPDLLYPPFSQGLPDELLTDEDIFEVLSKKNILLHHPYQSFAPVIDFIALAATDPDVLAIKQTLYRTGADSPIVDHLVTAASRIGCRKLGRTSSTGWSVSRPTRKCCWWCAARTAN